jgi:MFS family permease
MAVSDRLRQAESLFPGKRNLRDGEGLAVAALVRMSKGLSVSNNLESKKSLPSSDPPYPPAGYAWFVVGVLMLLYVFSFIDRQILSLLVAPIRADLHITDTQMSLLMGFSFAVFYALFGLPMARVADKHSRRLLIGVGVGLWSFMTSCCAFARNYGQLLLCRMGVGVGEAALSPAAYSLITDYFPRERLATAISVYGMGIYLGSGMAYLLGVVVVGFASGKATLDIPLLGALRPWQSVFILVGAPGFLLALLMGVIREPIRRGLRRRRAGGGISIGEVITYIAANFRTFCCHNIGFSLLALAGYGAAGWVPTFLVRVHGWTPQSAGTWYGIIVMVFGSLGILFGGRLADFLAERGAVDARLRTGVIAALAGLPFAFLYPLAPSGSFAIALLAPMTFTTAMPFGAAPAAIQEMMPSAMRAQASAIYLFVVNLIGMGLGPTAVASCTDYLFGDDNMVGYSLLVVGVTTSISAATLLFLGLKPFVRSMQYLKAWEAADA